MEGGDGRLQGKKGIVSPFPIRTYLRNPMGIQVKRFYVDLLVVLYLAGILPERVIAHIP